MIVVLSPAKSLDFDSELPDHSHSNPIYPQEAEKLVNKLKKYSVGKLKSLMNISEDLAQLNAERYQVWSLPFSEPTARAAIFAFTGDVYLGLEAQSLKKTEIDFAQKHLRILSGLYGVLRPLDLIMPYRLEMGTKLNYSTKVKNLYQFWGDLITRQILKDMETVSGDVLVNLASNEYFKSIDVKKVPSIITPEFRDWKNGEYKMIGFFAKRARGMMARYIVQHQITDPEQLKGFSESGYTFNAQLTKGNKWVFARDNNQ